MVALGEHGLPVPYAVAHNRHCVLMTMIDAVPLVQVSYALVMSCCAPSHTPFSCTMYSTCTFVCFCVCFFVWLHVHMQTLLHPDVSQNTRPVSHYCIDLSVCAYNAVACACNNRHLSTISDASVVHSLCCITAATLV